MKGAIAFVIRFYGWMIRLYPQPFRKQFGQEMAAVFAQGLEDAAQYGRKAVILTCWIEVRDWPSQCLLTHWQERNRKLAIKDNNLPSRWATTVVFLPYFLMAILVGSSTYLFLVNEIAAQKATLILGVGSVALLFLALLIGWWRGWPDWAASWLGYLFLILFFLFLPQFLMRQEQAWNTLPRLLQMMASEVILPITWLALLYVLLLRRPRLGILAMLPILGTTWMLYLEFVASAVSSVILILTWLWLGVTAIFLMRWKSQKRDVWLLVIAAVVVGLIYVIAGHFLTEVQVRERTLAAMSRTLFSELLPTLIPLVGLLLLNALRRRVWANGYGARWYYRLILVGLLAYLMSNRAILRLFLPDDLDNFQPILKPLLGVFILAALISILFGGLMLSRDRRNWPTSNKKTLWPLLGLIILLPMMVNLHQLPILKSLTMSLDLGANRIVTSLTSLSYASYLVGLGWLLLASWIISRPIGDIDN